MSSTTTGHTAASSEAASSTATSGKVVTLAELSAAETGAVVARLPGAVVLAHGPDAAPFLHGQVANDVTGLPVGGVNQSLSLNHKGHAVAEGSVLRRAKDEVLLAIDDDGAAWVVESLKSHIIFDQVALEEQPDSAILTVQGVKAAEVLPEAPEPGAFKAVEVSGVPVVVLPRRRSAAGGFDLLVDAGSTQAVMAALEAAGALQVGAHVIDALRVRALVPTAGGEGGYGVLPQEAGLEGSLSYRKGCYLGQEIMARIEARGNLRRSLVRLELASQPGSVRQITREGRTVGVLGSSVLIESADGAAPVVEALAVLRNDLPDDAQLEVDGVAVCRLYNLP